MLMQAEPVYLAYESIAEPYGKKPRVVYLTPQGEVFQSGYGKRNGAGRRSGFPLWPL